LLRIKIIKATVDQIEVEWIKGAEDAIVAVDLLRDGYQWLFLGTADLKGDNKFCWRKIPKQKGDYQPLMLHGRYQIRFMSKGIRVISDPFNI
jgi:hypothetical protein